jgi:hypothetical protein
VTASAFKVFSRSRAHLLVAIPTRSSSPVVIRLPNLSTDTLTENVKVSVVTDGTMLLVQFGPLDRRLHDAELMPIGTSVDALCAGDRLAGLAVRV